MSNPTIVTYTEADKAAAYEFSKANYYIRLIQEMSKVRPNIVSWLDVKIRDATQDDYFIPEPLIGRAKVITVNMTRKACEMVTCTPVRETKPCRKSDNASYYRTSESTFDVQCQPACFNTAIKPTYDTTNAQVPDTPQLRWHSDACRIVNHSVDSWETKPRYRSDIQYETRLNDLPIGFRRIPDSNPFGSGVTYKNDRAYCGFYEKPYDEGEDTCVTSLLDKVVGAVLGSSLLQNLKGGIKAAINGGNPLELPDYVHALPNTRLPTVNEWRGDVNRSFVVPELIDYTKTSSLRKKRDASAYEHPRVLLERRYRATASYSDGTGRILQLRSKRETTRTTNESSEPELTTGEKIWEGLYEYLSDKENTLSVIHDFGPSTWLIVKTTIMKLAEKLGPTFIKIITKITGSVGIRVIQTAVQSVASKIVTSSLFRIGAQVTLFLGRMLAAASTVVGWLLFVAFIFDLMFTFWDPFGYNNLFPPKLPQDTMYNGELALRQAFARPTADFEWEQLIKLLLSEDTIFVIGLESMTDQILYLDSLIVNSEGSVIDKGDRVSFDGLNPGKLEESNNAARAKQNHFTSAQFNLYNETFYRRARITKFLQKIGYAAMTIGGILLLIQLKLLAFLCLLFAITILCFGSLVSLNHDDVIEFVYNSPIKITDNW